MKETPSQEIFDEMKEVATTIWNSKDNTYGYVDEKLSCINSLENIQDNAMVFYRMFDIHNQYSFRNYCSQEALEYIKTNP